MIFVVHQWHPIVDYVGFDPVQHFNFARGFKGFGKGLDIGMIRNGQCRHSPLNGLLGVVRNGIGSIHLAHCRVNVEFNSFFIRGRLILAGGVRNLIDVIRIQRQIFHVIVLLD